MSLRQSIILAFVPAAAALAQPSSIDPAHKYCWGENIGFLNWRDASAASQGAIVHHTFLSGYIWAENAGWIHLGNGVDPAPASCFLYPPPAAQTGATFGVNIVAQGNLAGFAWGENIGWVNFGTAPFVPAGQQARYDRAAKRLRGYAWGANIGWINLDSAAVFVASTSCRADADGNGALEPADIALFVNIWFCSLVNGLAAGDFDASGVVDPADIALFVSAWFTAISSGSC